MRRRPRRHLHEPRKLRANAARPLGEWLPDLFVRQATVAATIARTSPHHTKSTAMENIPFRPPLHSRRGVLHLGQGMLAVGTPTTLLSFICPAAAATGDQNQWRFCNKCQAMFFDGYPNKGRCPAGGGHVAQGYEFILHHDDNRQRAQTQYHWRFCNKCHAMFWDGDKNKRSLLGRRQSRRARLHVRTALHERDHTNSAIWPEHS